MHMQCNNNQISDQPCCTLSQLETLSYSPSAQHIELETQQPAISTTPRFNNNCPGLQAITVHITDKRHSHEARPRSKRGYGTNAKAATNHISPHTLRQHKVCVSNTSAHILPVLGMTTGEHDQAAMFHTPMIQNIQRER